MTAKKKVSSTTRPNPSKDKAVASKAKALSKKAAKPKPTAKQASVKKVTKSVPVKKKPTAAVTKTKKQVSSKKAKSTPSSKVSSKTRASQKKDSATISKVKEIVSKSRATNQKEDTKPESTSFSFDDVLGLIHSKKKEKPKKVIAKKTAEVQPPKVVKTKPEKASKVKKLTTASIDDILGFGAPSVGPSRPVWDVTKVPTQWASYYDSLMSLRNSLKGSLGERSNETIGASARESGELSINSSDAGTETFDRDLALSMVANDQEALEEIEEAIDRIFDGSYGICLETQKPINKNRLKAVPFTRFSVEGQNLYERGRIKEKDFGTGTFATLADSTMGEED
jgi:RNA polymerase-binding transcription factor DksA